MGNLGGNMKPREIIIGLILILAVVAGIASLFMMICDFDWYWLKVFGTSVLIYFCTCLIIYLTENGQTRTN